MATDPRRPERQASGPAVSVNYVVGLLFAIYLLNYLDRQIVNILAEPIKQELGLADWQLGLMTGLAFAMFYTVLGLPLARYADAPRTDRGRLISVCLAAWSVMTALCGLAANFPQLLLARIGVGVGEAGCSPAAHSLISDIVPPERRARAMSIYSLGIPLGKLLGMALGGVVAQTLGWRAAFIVVGLPGIALAVLAWTSMPQPAAIPGRRGSSETFGEMFAELLRVRTFWWISFGGAFMAFFSYGQAAFIGSFFIRVHGLSVAEAGVSLGLSLGLAGALGTWLGGRLTDHAARRDRRAYVRIPALAAVGGGVAFLIAMMLSRTAPSVIMLSLAGLLNAIWYGPVFATVQGLVAPSRRATAAAIHLLILNLIGLGLGPLMFGALSDVLNAGWHAGPFSLAGRGPQEGLRCSLLLGSTFAVLAIWCFLRAGHLIEAELDAAEENP